ncbi:ensconsin-like [Dioscorea cayenensis subsp. rotundata]|uniref:Ensconsin-like n=1 Tax=Dioscorea cayennensis subsp. rotundata TaxID=55577 RepID=A0AB40BVS0_DIOCR|nr:ensconsin-like [Dioscorea cayenensis subsp. rotundata]
MEYERIHKVQIGVISPSKLRMKLLGAQNSRKKEDESRTSRTTSPSKLEEMEIAKDCLLAGDLDENEDSSKNSKVSSVMPVNQGNQSNSCSKDVAKQIQSRSSDDDGNEYDSGHDNGSTCSFEFHKGERTLQNQVATPFFRHLPSKWNDAEKWLVNRQALHANVPKKSYLHNQGNRHIVPNWGRVAPESMILDHKQFATQSMHLRITESGGLASQHTAEKFSFATMCSPSNSGSAKETSGVTDVSQHSDDSYNTPRLQKEMNQQSAESRALHSAQTVCTMRDIGTEMTPIPSQDPSRTGTPLGSTTPHSPISSLPSTPKRGAPAPSPVHTGTDDEPDSQKKLSEKEIQLKTRREIVALGMKLGKMNIASWASKDDAEVENTNQSPLKTFDADQQVKKEYEARAAAWEEAEMSKNMARFKHEEVKIQVWEKEQKAKIEAEMRKIEAQAEQMKANAQERMVEKLALTRRRVVEKQAKAEAKRNQLAVRAAQQVEQIRNTGRMPKSHHHRCCSWIL